MENLFWFLYLVSVAYCMWRIIVSYGKSSHDGVIGPTPGLDFILVVVLAPIYAIVDIVVTIVKYFKEKDDEN